MSRRHACWAGAVLIAVGLVGCSGVPDAAPSTTSAASTPATATPSASGSLDAALAKAVEDHLTSGPSSLDNVRAVLVSVDGAPRLALYRHGFAPADHEHLWSVTKSVVSTLIGQVIGDGLITGLDAPLSELLPEYAEVMSRQTAAVTLRQVLSMSGGFAADFPEDVSPRLGDPNFDAVRWALTEGRPGPVDSFQYSNVSAQVAAGVLAAAVSKAPDANKRSVLGYARAKLFGPLGIDTEPAYTASAVLPNPAFDASGFGWARSGALEYGGYGLRLTAVDLQKIGQLYLDDGMWQGRRLLPEGWVAQATSPSVGDPSYGLMWWIGQQFGVFAFAAVGLESQHIVVVPTLHAVITLVCKTGTDDPVAVEALDPLLQKVLIPALS